MKKKQKRKKLFKVGNMSFFSKNTALAYFKEILNFPDLHQPLILNHANSVNFLFHFHPRRLELAYGGIVWYKVGTDNKNKRMFYGIKQDGTSVYFDIMECLNNVPVPV